MKKFALLALAALSVFALACDPEDAEVTNDSIVGEWSFTDSHHSVTIDIKKDGTYSWETVDMKHTGEWTFADSKVTLTAKAFFTCGIVWTEEGFRVSDGKWESSKAENHIEGSATGKAIYTVEALVPGAAIWTRTSGNIFDPIGELPILMYKGDANLSIKNGELDGTWSAKDNTGETRIKVEGNKFTYWEYYTVESSSARCTKTTGTWTYSKGYLNIHPEHEYFSYGRGATGGDYTYSTINADTLEAETWYEAEYDLDDYKVKMVLVNGKLVGYLNPWGGEILTLTKKK